MNQFSRTELIIGKEGIEKLKKSTVAVFGIGGVGSFAAEALCRCGTGKLVLVDYDDICITNLNRQIHATMKTVGMSKVEAMGERLLSINPEVEIVMHKVLFDENTSSFLLQPEYDYVVDAIDMVGSKIALILKCTEMKIPIISCMGAGNKLDPTMFTITDIYKTSVCPLARVMRHELRKRGIKELKVVYSKEKPVIHEENDIKYSARRKIPGSISFVPPTAGLILASAVVRDILALK